jgi:hypothetical protein
MASLTRFVSINPFFSRFSMRDWFEEPDDLQAIVEDLERRRVCSLGARQGPSGRRVRGARMDSLRIVFRRCRTGFG